MSPEREQLIERIDQVDQVYSAMGGLLLRTEAHATEHIEYNRSTIATLAQTPEVATAYMRTSINLPPELIEFGLEIRQLRSHEAYARSNTLYITEQALGMDYITDDDGSQLPLHVSAEDHIRQLSHLIIVAQQPHIDMRILPREVQPPDFTNAIMFKHADHRRTFFQKVDKGPALVTDTAEMAQYQEGIAHLANVALSQEATLDFITAYQT